MVRQAAPFMAAAWVLTVALVGGALLGRWLDGRFGSSPWLLVAGLLLGLVVGLYEVGRTALRKGPER